MADEVRKEDLEDEEIEQDQYIVFSVKSQEFGFQAMRVREISSMFEIAEVPNAPSFIEGIMNLRGNLVSVINFRKKFGFKTKEHDEDTRIIVVEKDDFPIGIISDSVEEVIKIPDDKVQKLPESVSISVVRKYITGVGMLDKRLIILLDVDKVLTKDELFEAGEMTRIMEKTVETVEETENNKIEDSQQKNIGKRETKRRKR